jgi:hypothetical protein
MTSPDPAIRRVVVVSDAASGDGEGPGLGARLAAGWGAGLHGLFAEDADLLAAAGLPFVREIRADRGPARPLERGAVESELGALAARARGALAAAAGRHGIAHSFEVVRGSIPGGLPGFRAGDFLVLEGLIRPLPAGIGMASPWARLAGRAAQPHLLLRGNRTRRGPLALLLDGPGAAAERAAALACRLAELESRRLLLIGLGAAADLERTARGEPALAGAPRLSLPGEDAEAIGQALLEHEAAMLTISRENGLSAAITELIARTPLDVAVA